MLFMDIAKRTALESNCVKYKVGTVIVRDNRIILQGYNGTISSFMNCSVKFKGVDMTLDVNREEHRNWSNSFEVHAEMNIISYAARKGISLEGTTMYCTHAPCNNCLKHLIQAGVKEVIYVYDHADRTKLSDRESLLKLIKVRWFYNIEYD